MRSKNELKEIDIKIRVCYYFDDIINSTKINFRNILLDKKYMTMFLFTTFSIKLKWVQNRCVLGLIKQIEYDCS